MNRKLLTGVGIVSCAGIIALLCATSGFIGSSSAADDGKDFPYVSEKIKDKLTKTIAPGLTSVPDDLLETADYSSVMETLLRDKNLSLLGDSPEEQAFWYYLVRLRALSLYLTLPSAIDAPGFTVEWLDELGKPVFQFTEANRDKAAKILASVIRYEEAHPYNPQKGVEEQRSTILNLTRQEAAQMYEMDLEELEDLSDAEFEEQKRNTAAQVQDIPVKKFNKTHAQLIESLKQEQLRLQSGQSPEEFKAAQNAAAGIAEYAVHLIAPPLFPAELMFAEFVLDPAEDGAVYSYPVLFFQNAVSPKSARIEAEKPLPYRLYLMWYALAENTVYTLKQDLPRELLKEKIINGKGVWDGLLITIEPYGNATLYAYNQVTNKKDKLATFKAEATSVPFATFKAKYARYDAPKNPARDWNAYQKNALKRFPKAAENFRKNGRPVVAGINYWETNPNNIYEGVPSQEEINEQHKQGRSPLVEAINKSRNAAAMSLIKAGADVNFQVQDGSTPLLAAISTNNAVMVRALISAGAQVNPPVKSSGWTPLMNAAMNGNEEIVKMLLDAGADINAQTAGETALSLALINDQHQVAKLLRKSGAKEPQTESDQEVISEATVSSWWTDLENPEELRKALQSGANVNENIPGAGTALVLACSANNLPAARVLLEAGADVNIPAPTTGYTPLLLAVTQKNAALVKLLLDAGADSSVSVQVSGMDNPVTPLGMAQLMQAQDIIDLLSSPRKK